MAHLTIFRLFESDSYLYSALDVKSIHLYAERDFKPLADRALSVELTRLISPSD
jgi:hypothetical protein